MFAHSRQKFRKGQRSIYLLDYDGASEMILELGREREDQDLRPSKFRFISQRESSTWWWCQLGPVDPLFRRRSLHSLNYARPRPQTFDVFFVSRTHPICHKGGGAGLSHSIHYLDRPRPPTFQISSLIVLDLSFRMAVLDRTSESITAGTDNHLYLYSS